jgi:hypothetical protein
VTQHQLDRAVAVATGETIRDVRHRGFSVLEQGLEPPNPDDLSLAIDCPFCGAVVPYPGLPGNDAPALAACPSCDVEFEYAPHEVYPAGMTASQW